MLRISILIIALLAGIVLLSHLAPLWIALASGTIVLVVALPLVAQANERKQIERSQQYPELMGEYDDD